MSTDLQQRRLNALYARISQMESALEGAGYFLERGLARGWSEEDAEVALSIIRGALQQDFTAALLCSKGTTDEQLAQWLSRDTQEVSAP